MILLLSTAGREGPRFATVTLSPADVRELLSEITRFERMQGQDAKLFCIEKTDSRVTWLESAPVLEKALPEEGVTKLTTLRLSKAKPAEYHAIESQRLNIREDGVQWCCYAKYGSGQQVTTYRMSRMELKQLLDPKEEKRREP